MQRCLKVGLIMLFGISLKAQQALQLVNFSGQVLDPDSIPVAAAYLISYKTLRAYATNAEGLFNIQTCEDDSFKIHHVSFEPVVVKSTSAFVTLVLKENAYFIDAIEIKYKNLDSINLNQNMEALSRQLSKVYYFNYQSDFVKNPYAPGKGPTGIVELNVFEVYERIKRKLK
ncbi:MAG: hypothetical protein JXR22_13140 [Prolixibacteraceae bacterium]|nr:hypothetical protein [Prolixibacteraceae bacterium]